MKESGASRCLNTVWITGARGRLLTRAALFVFAPGIWAQQPDNVKIDSPQVKVLVGNAQPNHRGALHEHTMNRVIVYLGDGQLIRRTPDGKVEKTDFKAGDVHWSPAFGSHSSEYIASGPFRTVEIELKNQPNNSVSMPALDPLKADPKHYSLEFENSQVRVLRVRFGPMEKGQMHEHKLDHIVVYLNDQARGKAGEVR